MKVLSKRKGENYETEISYELFEKSDKNYR